jgi:hypothetical protein
MRAIIIIQDFDVVSRDYCFFGPVAQPRLDTPTIYKNHTASFFGPFKAIVSCFIRLRNKSVPRHGAKNILPVIERCTVRAAITSHIMTQIAVKT